MVKSLGDYNKEKSSSANLKNITWTQKNPTEINKPKNKSKRKIPSTNILPSKNTTPSKTSEKVYKIEENITEGKSKTNIQDKKPQKSSADNCKIKPSFKRRGR